MACAENLALFRPKFRSNKEIFLLPSLENCRISKIAAVFIASNLFYLEYFCRSSLSASIVGLQDLQIAVVQLLLVEFFRFFCFWGFFVVIFSHRIVLNSVIEAVFLPLWNFDLNIHPEFWSNGKQNQKVLNQTSASKWTNFPQTEDNLTIFLGLNFGKVKKKLSYLLPKLIASAKHLECILM